MATGVASSSIKIRSGGAESMSLRGWCSQQLKAELLYLSKIYCFKMWRFSSVGAQGNTGGDCGGGSLLGQEQGWSCWSPVIGTPEFEHLVGLAEVSDWMKCGEGWSQDPTSGKFGGSIPRSMQAFCDKYGTLMCCET